VLQASLEPLDLLDQADGILAPETGHRARLEHGQRPAEVLKLVAVVHGPRIRTDVRQAQGAAGSGEGAKLASMYERSGFTLRLRWFGERDTFPGHVRCEVTELLAQALLYFRVELPEDMGFDEDLTCVLRIGPECERYTNATGYKSRTDFELFTWESEYWVNEWNWTDATLTEIDDGFLDDLSDAMHNVDPEGVFDAFTALRGGMIEFAGWSDPTDQEKSAG